MEIVSSGPKGLKGWLWIFGYGLIVGAVGLVASMAAYLDIVLKGSWARFCNSNCLWLYFLSYFSLFFTLGLGVLHMIVVILFFQKKASFVRWATYYLMACPLSVLFSVLVMRGVPAWRYGLLQESLSKLVVTGVVNTIGYYAISALWIFYFRRSKRVRNTFTGV